MTDSFADATTRHVLGVDSFIGRLQPDSEIGRRQRRNPTFFGPGELDERRRVVRRRRRLDRWLDDHPDAHQDLRDALGHLPRLGELKHRLQNRAPVDRGLLFELKQFLYFADQVVATMGELTDAWSLNSTTTTARLRELRELIHPTDPDSPRFQLVDTLDDELASRRNDRASARRRRNSHRQTLEEAITDDYGGSFGFDGTYRPPDRLDAEDLDADDRLRQVGSARAPRWQLADEQLDRLQQQLDEAESTLQRSVRRVCGELSEQLYEHTEWLVTLQSRLAQVDIALAACRLKRDIDGCWGRGDHNPETVDRTEHTRIERGREPTMADRLGDDLQPISFRLHDPICVITGPNMGGKSKTLALLGLCQWCAQHALPIPADHFEFQPLHRLTYVGSEQPQQTDDFQRTGLSAFAREIRRIVRELGGPSPTGWLLDEVGRGTHPGDGADLLIDLLAALADDGDRAVASSHFPALASLEDVQHLQIRGLSDDADLSRLLDDGGDIDQALRRALDHQPIDVATGSVPRDARRVAAAIGFDLPTLNTDLPSHDPPSMTEDSDSHFDTKQQARDWVWTELRQQGAARFPFPIRDRIPNFDGAEAAARRLFEQTDLDDASAIKTNPDSPQKHVRRMALQRGLTVYVPTPRLKGGFMCFDPDTIDKADYEDASMLSRWDAHQQQVSLEQLPQLDAIITGCVAVTHSGKRCGKGEGYSDLEFAILSELGHDPVPVYTTVHSLQVVSDFPTEAHDLSLAGIATPERWIDTGADTPPPDGIDWPQLSDEDLEEMPILKELRSD